MSAILIWGQGLKLITPYDILSAHTQDHYLKQSSKAIVFAGGGERGEEGWERGEKKKKVSKWLEIGESVSSKIFKYYHSDSADKQQSVLEVYCLWRRARARECVLSPCLTLHQSRLTKRISLLLKVTTLVSSVCERAVNFTSECVCYFFCLFIVSRTHFGWFHRNS